jgi:hypothetical protein
MKCRNLRKNRYMFSFCTGSRRGMALLDLLLTAEKDHPQYLTPADIRNNVNTFIVAVNLNFCQIMQFIPPI